MARLSKAEREIENQKYVSVLRHAGFRNVKIITSNSYSVTIAVDKFGKKSLYKTLVKAADVLAPTYLELNRLPIINVRS